VTTVRLGLIGRQVAASLSPRLHACALELADLAGHYDLLPCETEADVRAVVHRLRAGDLAGVNVTAPWKPLARTLCDELVPVRMRRRPVPPLAVNTLWMRQDRLVGVGTDGPGLTDVLFGAGVPLTGARVVLLGAGGAGQAIAADVLEAGARHLTIVNRHADLAQTLALWLQAGFGAEAVTASAWGEAKPLAKATLVLHATSQGLAGKALEPGAFDWLPWAAWRRAVLFDLVYGHAGEPTPWQQRALDAGLPLDARLLEAPIETPRLHAPRGDPQGILLGSGLAMLAAQAARSFRAWTGVLPDAGRLLRAVL
jgi:shikimate dehydrogenase